MIQLRPYQSAAINAYFASVRNGRRNAVLCSPTGSGKTEMAMALVEHLVKHGKTVNFLVERDSLKQQTSVRFAKNGIPHGVLSGTENWGRRETVKIISQQTARAREIDLTRADLNICDESHVVHDYIAKQIKNGGRWLGLSATPFRKGMKDLYEQVLNVTTTDRLTQEGWLTPLKIYCGVYADPGGKSSTGEYKPAESAENVMLVIPRILEEWEGKTEEHFGGPAKTIVFANTVADAEEIAKAFREAGHDFHAVGYQTPQDEKEALIEAHRKGDVLGLVSCEMLQRGYDVPDIMVGVDCHHWRKSLTAVIQQAGRAMRPAPGKDFALWLDVAQNMLRHRDRVFKFWAEGCEDLVPMDTVAGPDKPDRAEALCPKCEALLYSARCRECGWQKPTPQRSANGAGGGTICVDGKLVPLDGNDRRQHVVRIGRAEYEIPPPAQGWIELCGIAKDAGRDADKGQKWCQANYRKMYGEFRHARFHPDKHYPSASEGLEAAVAHSTELYINRKKRERKAA